VLPVGLASERGCKSDLRFQVVGRNLEYLPVLLLRLRVRAGVKQDDAHVEA
jgi:hypothetical protein